MGKLYVHIVWSSQLGPMVAYRDSSIAFEHAGEILGVDVTTLEVRDRLPESVRDDRAAEFQGGDTPLQPDDREDIAMEITAAVPLDDIDDAAPK